MLKFVVVLLSLVAVWADAARISGGRIIGGNDAHAAQFPFAAAIYRQTSAGTYFCGGSLINDQWILTSGGCVANAVLFTIRLGSNSLTANDPNALRLATDYYFLHPQYNPDSYENDIGLIKLRLPVTFTDYIKPIGTLPTTTLPDASAVITVGWGQTSDEVAGVTDHLQYVFLTTLSNEECRLSFGNIITDSIVCVDGNYNEGTCRGDLGAPLIQLGGSSLTYQVGVSSFISTKGCESTDPSGFTRIAPYARWINEVISNN